MPFVIKAEISDPHAATFDFPACKTMYDGKRIATGDVAFLFASENEGGRGLVARGVVTAAEPIARRAGVTPRVSVTVRRVALARQPLGRMQLRTFTEWDDGRPETELNFKFYRQATNKISAVSEATGEFLLRHF